MTTPKVLFQDQSLVILEKPAGWVVNRSQTTQKQKTIQDWLERKFQFPIFKMPECRQGIVHRLDKETSGILIVAKTLTAFENLQKQFKQRKVKKTYTALVHGKVEIGKGEIKAPVGRLPWNRQRFGVLPGGRPAETSYKLKGHYQLNGADFSLLELYPKTGRTHQIRIHLKHLNHPVVADEFYAGRKTARNDRKWCPRLFLHASQISFVHPKNSKKITFETPLPEDLQKALKHLSNLA